MPTGEKDHSPGSFIVAQLGAREHYIVPRIFHGRQTLTRLYTDFWLRPWMQTLVRTLPGKRLMRMRGRCQNQLPQHLVTDFKSMLLLKLRGENKLPWEFYCREGKCFAENILSDIRRRGVAPEENIFFGFSSASLEILRYWRSCGGRAIIDQIDPLVVEHRVIEHEREKFPGWEPAAPVSTPRYNERVQEEWEAARWVLVNSEWTKRALEEQGVPAQKILTVPLAYSPCNTGTIRSYDGKRPLRILYLGSVILRKGVQYLLPAMRRLGRSVELKIAGPVGIDLSQAGDIPENVEFLGQVPRESTVQLWNWADVFILPTLSDGFAITQLEAMGHGLPVIATRCCGEVVQDGVNGLLIASASVEAIVEAVEKFQSAPQSVEAMSVAATARSCDFSPDQYYERLLRQMAQHSGQAEKAGSRVCNTPMPQNR